MNINDIIQPQYDQPRQQSAAWFQERIGKLTASRVADALSFLKNGNESAARKNLKLEIVKERMTDEFTNHFVTPAMLWGKEMEAEAKTFARDKLGLNVVDCGFFDHPDIDNFGASPDGLLGSDGLIEIKCPTSQTHINWVLSKSVPEEYKPQMITQLLCTGRKFVEFLSYDPRNKYCPYFSQTFCPTASDLELVRKGAEIFLTEVDTLFDQITQYARENRIA